ncbi:MAG: hypothetical protein ABI787_08155 [Spartobacteria bacterium]
MTPLILDLTNIVGLACWGVCFWWMHRISVRQEAMLNQLREQTERIERVSAEEHQILTRLRPSVEKIERDLDEVSAQVASNGSS